MAPNMRAMLKDGAAIRKQGAAVGNLIVQILGGTLNAGHAELVYAERGATRSFRKLVFGGQVVKVEEAVAEFKEPNAHRKLHSVIFPNCRVHSVRHLNKYRLEHSLRNVSALGNLRKIRPLDPGHFYHLHKRVRRGLVGRQLHFILAKVQKVKGRAVRDSGVAVLEVCNLRKRTEIWALHHHSFRYQLVLQVFCVCNPALLESAQTQLCLLFGSQASLVSNYLLDLQRLHRLDTESKDVALVERTGRCFQGVQRFCI